MGDATLVWAAPLRATAIIPNRMNTEMGSLVSETCWRQNGLPEPELARLRARDEVLREVEGDVLIDFDIENAKRKVKNMIISANYTASLMK
jgi:hypothetical protein